MKKNNNNSNVTTTITAATATTTTSTTSTTTTTTTTLIIKIIIIIILILISILIITKSNHATTFLNSDQVSTLIKASTASKDLGFTLVSCADPTPDSTRTNKFFAEGTLVSSSAP